MTKLAKIEERIWVDNYEKREKTVKPPSGREESDQDGVHLELRGVSDPMSVPRRPVADWASHSVSQVNARGTLGDHGGLRAVRGPACFLFPSNVQELKCLEPPKPLERNTHFFTTSKSEVESATQIAWAKGPRWVKGGRTVFSADGTAATRRPHAENKTGQGPHTFHKNESTIKPKSGMQNYETPGGEDRRRCRWPGLGGDVWKHDP